MVHALNARHGRGSARRPHAICALMSQKGLRADNARASNCLAVTPSRSATATKSCGAELAPSTPRRLNQRPGEQALVEWFGTRWLSFALHPVAAPRRSPALPGAPLRSPALPPPSHAPARGPRSCRRLSSEAGPGRAEAFHGTVGAAGFTATCSSSSSERPVRGQVCIASGVRDPLARFMTLGGA